MAWSDARAALKTKLESPTVNTEQLTAFEFPQAVELGDLPAAIIWPPARLVDRMGGGLFITYRLRVEVRYRSESAAEASERADDWVEGLITEFNSGIQLSGNVDQLGNEEYSEPEPFDGDGSVWTFDVTWEAARISSSPVGGFTA